MQVVLPRARDHSGQAMTELLLVLMPLILLIAAVFQIFLIDEHTFRLASYAHARLFEEAFRGNRANVAYDRASASWGTRDQWVPVVRFFEPYGLSQADLRIRSIRNDPLRPNKTVYVGRGTEASVLGGMAGLGGLNEVDSALEFANRWTDQLEAERQRAAGGGR